MLKERWGMTTNKTDNALLKTIIKCYKLSLIKLLLFNLIAALLDAVMPFLLREIMGYIEDEESSEGLTRALVFTVVMLFTMIVSRLLRENLAFYQLTVAVQANQALAGLIYNKILRVSSATNKSFNKGDIVSLIQIDANKIEFLFETLPNVSRIPFLLVFLIITLYMFVGMTFAVAIGLIIMFGITNYFLAKWSAAVQKKRMKKVDKRTNCISEVVDNIRLIKFNSWTEKFLDKVHTIRRKEIKAVVQKYLIWAINIMLTNLDYPMLAVTIFLVAVLGANLSIAVPTAFAILQILNSLHNSSSTLPLFVGDFMDFLVSIKRIQNFLCCPEIEQNLITGSSDANS